MATINMTDSDWLQAFAQMTATVAISNQPGSSPVNWVALGIPVTFSANEVFSEFAVATPFQPPVTNCNIILPPGGGFWDVSITDLLITHIDLATTNGFPSGINITGKNNSSSSLDVLFDIGYILSVY